MARGDRHLHEQPTSERSSGDSLGDARVDAHVWIDRAFDAVSGFVQGIGEVMRGASDIAAGRRPSRVRGEHASRTERPSPATVADLGEWYMDTVIDAETGHPVYMVTNGSRYVECRSHDMATEVIAALNEQGVRTRANEPAPNDGAKRAEASEPKQS